MQNRKYTFKIYPNKTQEAHLLEHLYLHQQLYNAALQERIDCYQKTGLGLSYNDQQKSLTQIRADDAAYKKIPVYFTRMTLRRLDKAFRSFFARFKKGQTAGFPRYKSLNRFSSFEMCSHGDGWNFNIQKKGHAKLHIRGIGYIKARGQARIEGKVKTSQVIHRYGQWFLSVTLETDELILRDKSTAKKACAIDWGVAHLMTLTEDNGDHQYVENPRLYQSGKQRRTQLQQRLSSKKRGSNNWKKACKKLSTLSRKQANQRKDLHHKLSTQIAKEYHLVAMEKLQIKNMSKSAKGNAEQHGKNVKQKSGLNREILDTAPAMLMSMIRYKVEETGGEFVETPTKKLKPSQRCPKCHHVHKDNRKTQASFVCGSCGFAQNADVVSGLNSLMYALGLEAGTVPEVFTLKPLLSVA